jgi:hypothetical protein
LVGHIELNQELVLVDKGKKMHIEADIDTFSRQDNLYDLQENSLALSREFFQASCGMEGLSR